MRFSAHPGLWVPLLFALLLTAPVALQAQDEVMPEARATEMEAAVETAPVTMDGRVLFRLRGVTSFPAKRRAAAVTGRLYELARDASFDPAKLAIVEMERDTRIVAGERWIVRIFDADGELEEVDRRVLSEVYVAAMREAIVSYRAARTREALTASAWRSAVATLLAGLAIFVVLRAVRRLDRWLQHRYASRLQGVKISSFEVLRAERMQGLLGTLFGLLRGLALIAVAFVWLSYVMRHLPWTRGFAAQLDDWVLAPIKVLVEGLIEKLPDFIFLAVLYFVARYVLRLIALFFAAVGRGEVELKNFDPDWAEPTYKIVRLAVVAFALIVAYPYIPGSSSAAFKGVSLFIGVVFSLSSSSAIANIIAGYTMIYRRAFREGDVVKIGDVTGVVTRIRLQVTHLRTPKNEEIVVPNSTILGNEIVNYSTLAKSDGLLLYTTVGIGYETPWRQVEAMLLEAAARTPGLRAEPRPFVLQTALADFAVTYEINVACEDPTRMKPLYAELHRNILDVFNEYGVQIMTPAYEGDPEQPKIVPKEQWHLPPATPR